MTHKIEIIRCTLTDGSYVYNVRLSDCEFSAIAGPDAHALVDALAAAICKHTCDDINIADYLIERAA